MHLSSYLSIHVSIRLSIYLATHPSIHPSVHPSIWLSILSMHLSMYPSNQDSKDRGGVCLDGTKSLSRPGLCFRNGDCQGLFGGRGLGNLGKRRGGDRLYLDRYSRKPSSLLLLLSSSSPLLLLLRLFLLLLLGLLAPLAVSGRVARNVLGLLR